MSTKVLDLDLAHLPDYVDGLEAYNAAFVLARWNGVPVGRAHIPLRHPRAFRTFLTRDELLAVIGPQLEQPFAEAWLDDWLGYDGRPNPSPLPSATVAICTRDRPDDLARCLASLMRLHQDGQQVLVVDSASKGDATRKVVLRFPGVRYVREEQPGLDRARNRALREAETEIVAFIDDDAVADPNWLYALLRNFDHPEIMCVTGLTMPVELDTEAQEISEKVYPYARGFARKVYDRSSLSPLGAGLAGVGVNMALRRDLLEVVGEFDELLDAGTPTKSGGDTDILAQILARGYRIVYDPAALNWHRHRSTREALQTQAHAYGLGPYSAFTAFWQREHDIGVFYVASAWFFLHQLPRLVSSLLRRPGSEPTWVVLAELRGCRAGIGVYRDEKRKQAGGRSG